MKRDLWSSGMLVTLLSLAIAAPAASPVVTITATSARIQVAAATLSETIDALSRAASFKVTYEGPRPSTMLFNAEIDTPNVVQTLNRLLEGQNLNYGVVLDLSGTKVTSLMIFGPALRAGGGSGSGPGAGRAQSFATPRNTRAAPAPMEDDPVEEPVPEPSPEPAPSPTPVGSTTRPSPFGPRPPFGRPFGAFPTPAQAPAPSPSPSA